MVLNSLGQAKTRWGDYEEADKLFRLALQKQAFGGDTVRHKIINLSSLADNLSRWARSCEKGRDYLEARVKLIEALSVCEEVVQLDKNDTKSLDLLRHILIQLGTLFKKIGEPEAATNYFIRAIVEKPVRLLRYNEAKDTAIAALQAAKIIYEQGDMERARIILTPELRKIREPFRDHPWLQEEFYSFWKELYEDPNFTRGKIIRVDTNRMFVVIASSASPDSTYLGHISNFESKPSRLSNILLDKIVTFVPAEENSEKGMRKIAKSIKVV